MVVSSAVSLLIAAVAGLALSTAVPGEARAQQQTPAATEIADEQLDAFVDAALDVQRVQQELSTELQGVEDRDEAQRLQQQAQQQAIQAIEAQGLTPDEYNDIVQAANNDRELYSTILAMMEEKRP